MTGELVLVAAALVWPAGGWVAFAVRRPSPGHRWRPFAWAAVAATVAAVALLAWAGVLLGRGGTTEAMASLGGQIGAVACLAGALVSGAVAGILRMSDARHVPPGPDRTDR
jgi:hypothetical protein